MNFNFVLKLWIHNSNDNHLWNEVYLNKVAITDLVKDKANGQQDLLIIFQCCDLWRFKKKVTVKAVTFPDQCLFLIIYLSTRF